MRPAASGSCRGHLPAGRARPLPAGTPTATATVASPLGLGLGDIEVVAVERIGDRDNADLGPTVRYDVAAEPAGRRFDGSTSAVDPSGFVVAVPVRRRHPDLLGSAGRDPTGVAALPFDQRRAE